MSYQTIEFAIADGVATLILNRPKSLNSFNAEMFDELRAVMQDIEGNVAVRSLLLTGNGRGFCAGQDLNDKSVEPGVADLGDGWSIITIP